MTSARTSRFREKDPGTFDPMLRALLEQSLTEEVIIPTENEVKARRIRQQFYSLRRAWRERAHEDFSRFRLYRSKVYLSSDVMAARRSMFIDEAMPYCLVVDSRDHTGNSLRNALAYGGPTMVTRAGPKGVRIVHDTDPAELLPDPLMPTEEERISALNDLLSSLNEEE